MLNISHINTNKLKPTSKRGFLTLRLGKISIGVVVVMMLFLLGLMYMLQVNEVSTMGYEIHDNDGSISQLQDEQERLQVEESKLKSLQGLKQEIQKLNYNEVQAVSYTTPVNIDADNTLAQR